MLETANGPNEFSLALIYSSVLLLNFLTRTGQNASGFLTFHSCHVSTLRNDTIVGKQWKFWS